MSSCFCLEWILMVLFTGSSVSGSIVRGIVGQNLTLPCSYSVDYYGTTSMCWGQGACPISKCSMQILWTDGKKVKWNPPQRYQLKGDILKGNVSLTIMNVAEADKGTYCCRVEIPGLFNDEITE
uniref:Ig-like domain-containing protein n=1 Tax=Sphenodon punctatus TaxID=8508 RepID=A0A8D0GR12_SPHPU